VQRVDGRREIGGELRASDAGREVEGDPMPLLLVEVAVEILREALRGLPARLQGP
jgi:hypothetical protein